MVAENRCFKVLARNCHLRWFVVAGREQPAAVFAGSCCKEERRETNSVDSKRSRSIGRPNGSALVGEMFCSQSDRVDAVGGFSGGEPFVFELVDEFLPGEVSVVKV